MKKIYIGLTAMLLTTFIYSCKKEQIQTIDAPIDVATVAQIKYFNFGVSSPGVNFFANGSKVTGTLSSVGTETTTGSASGTVYPQSGYSAISAGTYSFKAQIPSTAAADANLAIVTIPGTLENSKYYTLYTSGIYNTAAKSSDGFLIEDKLPAYNVAVAYVRLVNVTPTATSAISLFGKLTTVTPAVEGPFGNAVAYKTGSEFIAVPVGVYELYVRYPGTTANLISRSGTSAVSLAGGKVYTFAVRGDMTVSSTGTAATRPQIDFTTNR